MAITDPNDLTGIKWWYDFSDPSILTVDGSNDVTAIVSQTTNADQDWELQIPSARPKYGRPEDVINGVPALTMDGATTVLLHLNATVNHAYAQPITFFFLFELAQVANNPIFVRHHTNNTPAHAIQIIGADTNRFIAPNNRDRVMSTPWPLNTPLMWKVTMGASAQPAFEIRTLDNVLFDSGFTTFGPGVDGGTFSGAAHIFSGWTQDAINGKAGIALCVVGDTTTNGVTEDVFAWMLSRYSGSVQPPHTGYHIVQDTANANDPNNIYFGQGVDVGDTFSFKETTETNGWSVDIDDLGYPIIDPSGGSGTDSFLFNIDKGSGWEPEPPASYTWDFTIGVEGPVPPTYAPRVTYLRRPIAWDASSGWQGVDGGTWSASGLPAGYVINSTSGIVTGTATAAGTTQAVVTVDGVSAAPFDWTVEEKPGGGGSGSRGVNILRPKVHTRDIKRRGWRMGRRGRR